MQTRSLQERHVCHGITLISSLAIGCGSPQASDTGTIGAPPPTQADGTDDEGSSSPSPSPPSQNPVPANTPPVTPTAPEPDPAWVFVENASAMFLSHSGSYVYWLTAGGAIYRLPYEGEAEDIEQVAALPGESPATPDDPGILLNEPRVLRLFGVADVGAWVAELGWAFWWAPFSSGLEPQMSTLPDRDREVTHALSASDGVLLATRSCADIYAVGTGGLDVLVRQEPTANAKAYLAGHLEEFWCASDTLAKFTKDGVSAAYLVEESRTLQHPALAVCALGDQVLWLTDGPLGERPFIALERWGSGDEASVRVESTVDVTLAAASCHNELGFSWVVTSDDGSRLLHLEPGGSPQTMVEVTSKNVRSVEFDGRFIYWVEGGSLMRAPALE